MNLAQAAAAALVHALRRSNLKLQMKTVQDWIDAHGNAENHGRGYAGNSLHRGPSQAFIEVTRSKAGSKFNVEACAYLSARTGAVARQEWRGVDLDAGLKEFFGRENRVRIRF